MGYFNNMPYSRNMYDQSMPAQMPCGATGMVPYSYSAMIPPSYGAMIPPSAQMLPAYPTGGATGPAYAPIPGTTAGKTITIPGTALAAPMPLPALAAGEQPVQTTLSVQYTPGFLRTQIGKLVRVEFLMSSGPLVDRVGTLIGVGVNYILLRPIGTNDTLLCDIYSIKFVTFYISGL